MAGQKTEEHKVVDFNQKRGQKLDEKRRKTERVMFQTFVGVYSVIGQGAMQPIELIDVSEEGLSFKVAFDPKNPWPAETVEIPIRLYFSNETYLPLMLKVVNSSVMIGEGGQRFVRYGCTVDRTFQSYEAFRQFASFMVSYSEQAHWDDGKTTAFYR